MLEELLDLRRKGGNVTLHTPANAAGIAFLALLEDDAEAFDKVRPLHSISLAGNSDLEESPALHLKERLC